MAKDAAAAGPENDPASFVGGPNAFGEPCIVGTDIPVHRVAALVRHDGSSLDLSEARKGFPSLADGTIEAVYRYGLAHPHDGPPYPSLSLKSRLAEIEFPEWAVPLPEELIDRVEALAGGVDVDLDAPLSPEDE
jgi:uncharacterized protein (DUF433 family)